MCLETTNYRVSVYAIHMPSIPPTTLPSNEVKENESAPIREGTYPPATEPIIIPSIIIDFRDMVVTETDVYFHVLPQDPKSLQNYFSVPHGSCLFFFLQRFNIFKQAR
jgi:hypothetical protein